LMKMKLVIFLNWQRKRELLPPSCGHNSKKSLVKKLALIERIFFFSFAV
jgi:hypothetical protein